MSWWTNHCYFYFDSNAFTCRSIEHKREYSALAEMELEITGDVRRVVAIGGDRAPADSLSGKIQICRPFDHPRVLVDDLDTASAIVRHAIGKVFPSRWRLRPRLVLHPRRILPGGLCPLERRALEDLAAQAGATHFCIHEGPLLSDDEVRASVWSPVSPA